MNHVFRQRHILHLLMVFLIVVLVRPPMLHAGRPVDDAFGLSAQASWYGSIPSAFHEDDLPIRSHLSLGGTITPFILGFSESWELSAGFTGFYTSRSMVYGTTVWRSFAAIGPTIEATYHLDRNFSLSAGTSIVLSMYIQTLEFAPLWRVSITAGYDLMKHSERNRLTLTLPISVDLRTDYISVSSGLGIIWKYDRKQEGDIR